MKDNKIDEIIISDTDRAYLAGIIDGEGGFSITKGVSKGVTVFYQATVYVVNTDFSLINWLQDTFGGSVYDSTISNIKCKDKKQWVIRKDGIERIIRLVYPYLKIKKERAQIMLSYLNRVWDSEESFYIKMKELNKRGR
jgi:hypothetical protein